MDELKNCKVCGKIYTSNGFNNVCNNCISRDEDDFEKIREYLYLHPHASMYEVATNLEITINKIKHYLRDGRIEIIEKDNQFLTCNTCGKPIHTGWYCDECLKTSNQDLKSSHTGSSSGESQSSLNKSIKTDSKINFLSKNKK
jgi:uncharacterized protein